MIRFSHANREGTGSQMTCSFRAARPMKDGAVTFSIIPQLDSGHATGRAKFNTADRISVSLDIRQVAQLFPVLADEGDTINKGKGIQVRGDTGISAVVHADRVKSPYSGVAFHFIEFGEIKRDGRIILNDNEVLALTLALDNSMGRLAFCDDE